MLSSGSSSRRPPNSSWLRVAERISNDLTRRAVWTYATPPKIVVSTRSRTSVRSQTPSNAACCLRRTRRPPFESGIGGRTSLLRGRPRLALGAGNSAIERGVVFGTGAPLLGAPANKKAAKATSVAMLVTVTAYNVMKRTCTMTTHVFAQLVY